MGRGYGRGGMRGRGGRMMVRNLYVTINESYDYLMQ